MSDAVLAALAGYRPADEEEAADVERVRALLRSSPDPWARALPLHLTASALVVHPPSGRVLLRWHAKQQRWLQVGGHADPGEDDPWRIARREAGEETGLDDLRPWPGDDPAVFQVAVVPVAAAGGDPPHEHADLRYLVATSAPEAVPDTVEGVPVRWLDLAEALTVADPGLARLLRRVTPFLDARAG